MKKILTNLLLSTTLLTTIYMNDGSYVWVDRYDLQYWIEPVTVSYWQMIGIKYKLSGVEHKVPFNSIKEITSE